MVGRDEALGGDKNGVLKKKHIPDLGHVTTYLSMLYIYGTTHLVMINNVNLSKR